MRNCPELVAELKRRRASRQETPTVNLIDNFESSDSDDDILDSEPELAVNLTELNFADHCTSPATDDRYVDSGASKHVIRLQGPFERTRARQ